MTMEPFNDNKISHVESGPDYGCGKWAELAWCEEMSWERTEEQAAKRAEMLDQEIRPFLKVRIH